MGKILIGLVSMAFPAAAVAHPQPHFTCDMAPTSNGWCQGCRVGYVATVEIRSADLFEALDANGHDVDDPDAVTCDVCREDWATGGYCYDCRVGWVDGHAYHTKLSYLLARGEVVDPAKIKCGVDAWCEPCEYGVVGNVAFRNKKDYVAATKQFELLLRAVKESERCEMCSMLLFYDGICQDCKITYKNGHPKP